MSLVGSLEDLGLADILQIVSLARKSGRLLLRSDDGEGWIALQDGLVRGAGVKGQSEGLRALLVGPGHVAAEIYDRASRDAKGEEPQLEAALLGSGAVTNDSLQAARRGGVERAVMRMFGWRSGEFRFEVRDDIDASESGSLLATGLNTQYLAMEATRLGDELSREPEDSLPVADPDAAAADALLFSGEAEPADSPEPPEATRDAATHRLALASAEAADAEPEPAAAEIVVSEEPSEPAPVAVRLDAASPAPASLAGSELHLVAVDADLGALEWLKASVEGIFRRVHIFQHAGAALERVRQYLRRGQLPVVAISSRMPPDNGAGIADADALVARLRALAPRMPLVALVGPGKEAEAPPGVDAALARPISPGLDPASWDVHGPAAERVRRALETYRGRSPAAAPPRGGPSLASVKAASERLRDEVAPGEILTLALDFAAQSFSRAALFMLRDEVVEGIGARGLDRAGGPQDLRSLQLVASERPELVARVLRERRALRASPASARDRAFLARLGETCPNEVYLAPIESAGCVVALLYADNLPGGAALGDTTALEIVLHEAGLALDRASLERALSGA
ncbi:MAG TPA: DUF4388 domain-containing protein [Myxococcota bacterium]|nr:DUF4388 domain-containing protein [Myxococcota bacterium]